MSSIQVLAGACFHFSMPDGQEARYLIGQYRTDFAPDDKFGILLPRFVSLYHHPIVAQLNCDAQLNISGRSPVQATTDTSLHPQEH
jgi:hypothetical protein